MHLDGTDYLSVKNYWLAWLHMKVWLCAIVKHTMKITTASQISSAPYGGLSRYSWVRNHTQLYFCSDELTKSDLIFCGLCVCVLSCRDWNGINRLRRVFPLLRDDPVLWQSTPGYWKCECCCFHVADGILCVRHAAAAAISRLSGLLYWICRIQWHISPVLIKSVKIKSQHKKHVWQHFFVKYLQWNH